MFSASFVVFRPNLTEGSRTKMNNRGITSKSTTAPLTKEIVALIRGMVARGDRKSDIAAYFNLNIGRVSQVTNKRDKLFLKFADVPPAKNLPPQGPYVVLPEDEVRELRAAHTAERKRVQQAIMKRHRRLTDPEYRARLKAAEERYRKANAEAHRKRARKWYAENRARVRQKQREYYEKHLPANAHVKAWRKHMAEQKANAKFAARSEAAKERAYLKEVFLSSPEGQAHRRILLCNQFASRLICRAKSSSRKRGYGEVTVTPEQIREKLYAGHCEVTGLPFDFTQSTKRKFLASRAPSLDRKDSTKGYTPDNTQVVVLQYNLAKGEWGDEELKELARALLLPSGDTGKMN